MTPFKLLREAVQAVPAMKYAVAAVGLAAAASIALAVTKDARTAVLGGAIVIGFMFLLLVFAKTVSGAAPSFRVPATVLTWVFTAALIVVTVYALFILVRREGGQLVASADSDAVLYSDDKAIATLPAGRRSTVSLPPGEYELTAKSDGLQLPWRARVIIAPHTTVVLEIPVVSLTRLAYFAGRWRSESEGTVQWAAGPCAVSTVHEKETTVLRVDMPAGDSGVCEGQAEYEYDGKVVEDGTPAHNCTYFQTARSDYKFTSYRSARITCSQRTQCDLEITVASCAGDCKYQTLGAMSRLVIPETQRRTDSFLATDINGKQVVFQRSRAQ